jgi:hypothetical protein
MHSLNAVDLSLAARREAKRLSEARVLIAGARPFVADGPLVWITHRRRIRRCLRRRVLLLYRSAYEDAGGHLAQSVLVAVTIALRNTGLNVRAVDWANASWLSGVDDGCLDWREAAQRISGQFASTRLSRERAIASIQDSLTRSFQPGLFDRRAHRAHVTREQADADFSARLAARLAAVESGGRLALRAPELLLVLIPSDAAGV